MAIQNFKAKNRIETTATDSSTPVVFIPSGTIALWPLDTVPSGWLECNGTSTGILRSTYSDLYAAIGTTYGSGDGSTTFNLPNLLGRVVIGSGSGSGLITRTTGEWGGSESITITDDMITHTHSMSPHTHSMSPHTHSHSGHAYNAHGTSHTHNIDSHAHGISAGNAVHSHAMWFGNTGAPGTAQPRNNTTGGSPGGAMSDLYGGHSHSYGAVNTSTTATVETSGTDASATGTAAPALTGGPSASSTPTYTGTATTIGVVQASYVLKYIIKV